MQYEFSQTNNLKWITFQYPVYHNLPYPSPNHHFTFNTITSGVDFPFNSLQSNMIRPPGKPHRDKLLINSSNSHFYSSHSHFIILFPFESPPLLTHLQHHAISIQSYHLCPHTHPPSLSHVLLLPISQYWMRRTGKVQ